MVSRVGDNITGDSAHGLVPDPVSELTFYLCARALVVPIAKENAMLGI
jgi:hypothetical protein